VIFPKYQLVGYVGLPGSPALGPLDKDLDAKAAKLEKLSQAYAAGRTPQPVLELIAIVAKGSGGKDGLYRGRLPDSAIENYLTVARKHKMLLLLDIQPGRAKTTGAELDGIASYLSGLVQANDLPEKVFVFHQLSTRIVSNERALKKHPGVVTIKSVDGIGARTDKLKTWAKLTTKLPPAVHTGFKLFYTEDTRQGPLMTPPQVLALKPRPEFVVYE
jgi:hypothetical protein